MLIGNDQKKENKITLRAIILAFLLVIPNSFLSVQTPTATAMSLIYPVIFNLLVLLAINLPLKHFVPKYAFTQAELLTVYVVLSLTTIVSGLDMVQVLVPLLGHPFYYATPENEWQSLFWQYLPRWLTVDNIKVLEGYCKGETTFHTLEHIKAWSQPIIWWSVFFFMLMMAMLFANVLIRRQWAETEKLSYPIIQLPLRMTEDGGSAKFYKNRMLWLGFALAGGVDLINGFHYLLPAIPLIPTRSIELGQYFVEKPWSAMGWTPVCFFPFIIGIATFMPLNLSFSCWFFYLLWKVQLIFADALGLGKIPEFPYVYYKSQASGAYIAVGLFALWTLRHHLVKVLKMIFSRSEKRSPQRLDDSGEPMRYRTALIGILVCLTGILIFCLKAGLSLWIFPIFFGIYFTISLAIARIRAELGPPVNELYHIGPDMILVQALGTHSLGAQNLSIFSLFWSFNRSNRCHPMPHQLEAFKLAEQSGMDSHRLMKVMIGATAIAMPIAMWCYLFAKYRYGDVMWSAGYESYSRLQSWIYFQPGAEHTFTVLMVVGFCVVILLSYLHTRFVWWNLHPVAYPLSSSLNWSMSWMWSSVFVSWLIKYFILKYGGIKSYRKAVPFFMGLILGDYLIGGFWNSLGVFMRIPTYTFWH